MTPIPKRKRFESPTYRGGARGERCVLCDNAPAAGSCHLPHAEIGFTAGIGQKTHDWLTADLCDGCHFQIDHGGWRNDHAVRMKALCLTLQRRFDQGLLQIEGEDHETFALF